MEYDDAILILSKNFTWKYGVIEKQNKEKTTDEENQAIDYLFHEWDFTYRGEI